MVVGFAYGVPFGLPRAFVLSINPARASPARWSKIPSACCVSALSTEDRPFSIRAAATSLYERCVACLSSTSDPCASRTWRELATPLPRCRSVATCGRSHLCFRGAQASGRVLTSVRRTWLGASELQPNKYIPHTPHACASSLSQLGALSACVKPTRPTRSTVSSGSQVAWGLSLIHI